MVLGTATVVGGTVTITVRVVVGATAGASAGTTTVQNLIATLF